MNDNNKFLAVKKNCYNNENVDIEIEIENHKRVDWFVFFSLLIVSLFLKCEETICGMRKAKESKLK